MLESDATRLAQVFANLLNNAAKYTPPGWQISVSVEHERNRVTVVVKDTGVGIEPWQEAHIFEVFTQLEGARTRPDGGLCIGLGLTKQLVEMHGGSIAVTSAGRNQGSAFAVTLQTEHRAHVDAVTPLQSVQPVTQRFDTPRPRVLVVDDNPDAADMLGLLLEPARSAMVRATRLTRWKARADSCNRSAERSSN